MKKFSNITKSKVGKAPEIKERESNPLRYPLRTLMDDLLHIRINNMMDPIIMETLSIQGKEEFISAILDFFQVKEVQDKLKLLNEAKYQGIDNSIIVLENLLLEKQTASLLLKHDRRIEDILRKANGDMTKALTLANTQANRITDAEKAHYRGLAAEKSTDTDNKEILVKLAEIFKNKAKELGYTA
jgi:hypothetical protein